MRRRSVIQALAAAVVVIGVASCSDGSADRSERAPAERLAAAKVGFDQARSVALELTSTDVPTTQTGVTAAQGTGVVSATEPKFQGSITGRARGVTGQVEVVAIGETTWVKLFTPDFVETDLDTLNAPNPATFFDPERGISALLAATADPAVTDERRSGREVLTQVTGTLAGERVTGLLGLGDSGSTYRVTYALTADDQLRTTTLVGPFFDGAEATYTLTLTDYGETVAITRP
ncbi:MAG: LppX_LprAFG lipoprotein, partial [Dermatophilaceae bacterium]